MCKRLWAFLAAIDGFDHMTVSNGHMGAGVNGSEIA